LDRLPRFQANRQPGPVPTPKPHSLVRTRVYNLRPTTTHPLQAMALSQHRPTTRKPPQGPRPREGTSHAQLNTTGQRVYPFPPCRCLLRMHSPRRQHLRLGLSQCLLRGNRCTPQSLRRSRGPTQGPAHHPRRTPSQPLSLRKCGGCPGQKRGPAPPARRYLRVDVHLPCPRVRKGTRRYRRGLFTASAHQRTPLDRWGVRLH
jgi:hypothetical protein